MSDGRAQLSLPAGASFPAVPGHLLAEAAPCGDVTAFLASAESWRERTRAWLVSPVAVAAPISDEMRRILRAAVADPQAAPGALAAARIYRLEPFPAPSLAAAAGRTNGNCEGERRRLIDVLVWRALLVDFLSDVWDVMGPPLLEMEECEWVIRELLTPQSAERLCVSCLQPLSSSEAEQRHFDACVVRIARGDPELG